MTTVLLSGGLSPVGERLDLRCDPATGLIAAAAPALEPIAGETVVDCTGKVLLPGPVEPHAHLDKALSAGRAPNPTGDLPGAITAWRAYRPQLDHADILSRAREAALELVAHGTTTIRSHVDVGDGIGLRGIQAVAQVRDELRAQGLAELQVVALISPPLCGTDGEAMRALLREAMTAGADVVGGCPHIEPDPAEATRELVAIAADLGLPIDLHVDETLDPRILGLRAYAAEVSAAGAAIPGAVAGHCVSLGVQEPEIQAQVAAEVRDAGIAVVTLPQTNLYLQSRDRPVSTPRGLTAVKALMDAGACVCAGADNVRDPFNAVGRSDALETASLLVMAAHLSPAEAWHLCSNAGRQALKLPAVNLAAGDPAEVLAVRGSSLADAIARSSEDRVVVHRGAVVATTTVTTTFQPPAADGSSPPANLSPTLVPAS
ncbi:MAG: amidohydrolase family protein [Solirubrobacteraceae bacterium]|nr:amidohydrolase family protein [Solirubrobacteraceae bacterium]